MRKEHFLWSKTFDSISNFLISISHFRFLNGIFLFRTYLKTISIYRIFLLIKNISYLTPHLSFLGDRSNFRFLSVLCSAR